MINLDLKLNDDNIRKVLEEDYIGRNKYINGLMNILNSLHESKIIALDGNWGSGKTFFLKSLEYLMNNEYDKKFKEINEENLNKLKQEYMLFYYNAWENDDASSAMLSLIYKLINDCFSSTIVEENVDVTVNGIAIALNTIIKFITAGSIDVKEDVFGEKWTSKKITDEIITSEEIKQTFRDLIKEILSEKKNKILIIIDEIDRCKPTFAIDLLENIKHFYDDDRVVFIVATNNKQLGASVCKVYGEKYDGYEYLDKFFDMNLELPDNYLEKYIKAIDEHRISSDYYFKCCREIAKYKKMTMREYNRYLNSIQTMKDYLTANSDFDLFYIKMFTKNLLIPLALELKIKEKDKYYEFISGNLFAEIENLIRNNSFFYEISLRMIKNKTRDELSKIEETQSSDIEKESKKLKLVLENLKSMYSLLNENNNQENTDIYLKSELNTMLDMMSMLN